MLRRVKMSTFTGNKTTILDNLNTIISLSERLEMNEDVFQFQADAEHMNAQDTDVEIQQEEEVIEEETHSVATVASHVHSCSPSFIANIQGAPNKLKNILDSDDANIRNSKGYIWAYVALKLTNEFDDHIWFNASICKNYWKNHLRSNRTNTGTSREPFSIPLDSSISVGGNSDTHMNAIATTNSSSSNNSNSNSNSSNSSFTVTLGAVNKSLDFNKDTDGAKKPFFNAIVTDYMNTYGKVGNASTKKDTVVAFILQRKGIKGQGFRVVGNKLLDWFQERVKYENRKIREHRKKDMDTAETMQGTLNNFHI